jgi:hypothetical protein
MSSQPIVTRWDRFLHWAGRFHADPSYNENERDYKLEITGRLEAARAQHQAGDPQWVEALAHAITTKPNNLTNWRATQPLIAWCRGKPEEANIAFRFLWNSEGGVASRMDQFAQVASAGLSKSVLIAETSFLHMANDPYAYPMYRAKAVERAMDLTGYPVPKEAGIKSGELGRRYEHYLRFLDITIKRGAEAGIEFQDRLDAQGAIWCVTQWVPYEHWPQEDRVAFRQYQGNDTVQKASWKQPTT